eukprot:g16584.t1
MAGWAEDSNSADSWAAYQCHLFASTSIGGAGVTTWDKRWMAGVNPHTTEEVYNNSLSYQALSQFRAVVGFPYDTSLMFFWEFYSMNMPMFVPFDLWHWGIFGQHTRPDLEQPRIFPEPGILSKLLPEEDRLPYSPYFDGFGPLDVERSIFWSKYTDWAMFPHVQYFTSIPHLMTLLLEIDLQAISSAMKHFNEEHLSLISH